jgi:hypothetical protein
LLFSLFLHCCSLAISNAFFYLFLFFFLIVNIKKMSTNTENTPADLPATGTPTAPTTAENNTNTNTEQNNNTDKKKNKNNKIKKEPRPPKVPRPKNIKPEKMISRKETGNTKQRVAVLFGYVGTGYYGLQWDDKGEYPSMSLFFFFFSLPSCVYTANGYFLAIEKDLEEAIYKMGGILETNHGNLDRVQWARGSRTDKGV